MADGRFFPSPHSDAQMGAMLALTGELLLLSARQRRLEAAVGSQRVDLTAPLDETERAWVAQRADALVAGWLDPFLKDGGAHAA